MLAQTISSKKSTAPISISSAGRDAGDELLVRRDDARAPSFVAVAVVGGNARRQQTHFFFRLPGRGVGGNAPHDHQRPRPARPPVQILGVEGERRPELSAGRGRELEVRRHDANDRVRLCVELNRSADDARFRAEDAPPERVAQDDDPRRAEQPFFGKKRAAEPRVRLEDGEQLRRSPDARDADRIAGSREREIGAPVGGDRFQAPDIGLPVFERRNRDAIQDTVGVDFPEDDDLLRIVVRQRVEDDGLDDAEERGVRADAEGERHERDQREGRLPPQRAERVSEGGEPVGHNLGARGSLLGLPRRSSRSERRRALRRCDPNAGTSREPEKKAVHRPLTCDRTHAPQLPRPRPRTPGGTDSQPGRRAPR